MAILDSYNPRDASRGYVWIQIRTNLLDEPEYMQLTDQTKAVYLEIYILAGRSDAGGLVLASDKPATVEKIAWLLRRTANELQTSLRELESAGFVDLQGDQVTVCRFASEQGPSMADTRKVWALRQAKRRALAKGEAWTDEPEPDASEQPGEEPEPGKIENSDAVKELNNLENSITSGNNNNKTKRVTELSRESHAGVTRDSGSSSLLNEYADTILSIWQAKTGKKYGKIKAFLDMCQYWIDEGVNIGHVTESINLVQGYAEPNTPMYLRDVVINLKNTGPKNALDYWRELWDKSHSEGK